MSEYAERKARVVVSRGSTLDVLRAQRDALIDIADRAEVQGEALKGKARGEWLRVARIARRAVKKGAMLV